MGGISIFPRALLKADEATVILRADRVASGGIKPTVTTPLMPIMDGDGDVGHGGFMVHVAGDLQVQRRKDRGVETMGPYRQSW